MNFSINKLFIVLIRFYQLSLSYFLAGHCKFHPTCSHYALESFQKFNFIKALGLTLLRLSKCHPLSFKSGFDPVPLNKE